MAIVRSLVLIALALAAAPQPAVAAPQSIAPGYWETNNQVVSPIRQRKIERRCIRAADVAKFMEGPSNHIYRCTYPTRVIRDGTIRLKGSCTTKKGPPVPVAGQGSFTRDTFQMEAEVAAQFGPLTIPVRARTDARRLGDECPEPAPAPEAAASGKSDQDVPQQ